MNSFVRTQSARAYGSADQPRYNVFASFKNLCGVITTHLADSLARRANPGGDRRAQRAADYDSQVLRQAVHTNSPHELDWLLTAAIITDAAKRRYCLERALAINPDSEPARRAIEASV